MLLALALLVPGHCFYFCLSHADDEAQFCFNLYFVLVVQAVGELLAYRNVPLINWVSTGQSIANKIVLDTYIRTMAPISSLGESILQQPYNICTRRLDSALTVVASLIKIVGVLYICSSLAQVLEI